MFLRRTKILVFSDRVIATHEQNPTHDMMFSENIGP